MMIVLSRFIVLFSETNFVYLWEGTYSMARDATKFQGCTHLAVYVWTLISLGPVGLSSLARCSGQHPFLRYRRLPDKAPRRDHGILTPAAPGRTTMSNALRAP